MSKITHAASGGDSCMIETVENFIDLDIDYYAKVNFKGLMNLVDALGGIDVDVPYSFCETDENRSFANGVRVYKGWQHLNGIQVLTVSRERLKLPGGDRARQKNVQALMTAIFKKMASPEIITKFDSVLTAVDGMYETSVPMANVTAIIKDTMANGNNWKINQQSVDGSDGHAPVNLGQGNDWVMFPNQESIDKAKVVIQEALK
jgi:LCP family protein required for cell wall assembly